VKFHDRLRAMLRGASRITLDSSPRLRKLREGAESRARPSTGPFGTVLPDLPDWACPPGAVPLDTSGVPDARPASPGGINIGPGGRDSVSFRPVPGEQVYSREDLERMRRPGDCE
jgi:hypothetical protein